MNTKEATAAMEQIADLSKSLEQLEHIELFKIIQALLVLRTQSDIPERSRELFTALIKLMTDWMSEPKPKQVCYEHGVELDENGICPVSGVKGRKEVK